MTADFRPDFDDDTQRPAAGPIVAVFLFILVAIAVALYVMWRYAL